MPDSHPPLWFSIEDRKWPVELEFLAQGSSARPRGAAKKREGSALLRQVIKWLWHRSAVWLVVLGPSGKLRKIYV